MSSIQESNCPPTLRSNNTHTPALPYLTVLVHLCPSLHIVRLQSNQSERTKLPKKRSLVILPANTPPSSLLQSPRVSSSEGGNENECYLTLLHQTSSCRHPACFCMKYVRRYQNGQLLAPRFHIHCTARKKKTWSFTPNGPPHPVPARPFLSRPLVIPLH